MFNTLRSGQGGMCPLLNPRFFAAAAASCGRDAVSPTPSHEVLSSQHFCVTIPFDRESES